MIVKVNRVSTIDELKELDKLKADIIGISIDRKRKEDETSCYDSRAISLEEAIEFKQNITHAKLAILVNLYDIDNKTLWKEVLESLQPDFINYFLPLYVIYDSHNKTWFDQETRFLNSLSVPVILFGESIGYDQSFYFHPGDEKIIKNLSFLEINCFTLNRNNPLHIRPEKYYGLKQSESTSLHYETVQSYFEKMNILLDDDFDKRDIRKDVENSKAKGVTLSLKSREGDIWTEKLPGENIFNSITANTYGMEEITELLLRVKSGGGSDLYL